MGPWKMFFFKKKAQVFLLSVCFFAFLNFNPYFFFRLRLEAETAQQREADQSLLASLKTSPASLVEVRRSLPIEVIQFEKLQDHFATDPAIVEQKAPPTLAQLSEDAYAQRIQSLNERFAETSKLQKGKLDRLNSKFEDDRLLFTSSLQKFRDDLQRTPADVVSAQGLIQIKAAPATSTDSAPSSTSSLSSQCNIDCATVKNCEQAKIDCLQVGMEDMDAAMMAERCAQLLALNQCKPECQCDPGQPRTDVTKTMTEPPAQQASVSAPPTTA